MAIGVLLQPDFPPTSAYIVEWSPDTDGYRRFQGQVTEVRIGQDPLPASRIEDIATLTNRLSRGDPLTIAGTAAASPQSMAALFSLGDRRGREIWVIAQSDTHVDLELRTKAATIRLQQPGLRFEGLLRDASDSAFSFSIAHAAPGFRATAGPDSVRAAFRPYDGWRLLWYGEWLPGWIRRMIDVGWIVGLVAPLALWSGRSIGIPLALGVAAVLGSFVVTTGVRLLAPPGWIEATGLGLAALAAIAIHRWMRENEGTAA